MPGLLIKSIDAVYFLIKGHPLSSSGAYNPEKLTIIAETLAGNCAVLGVLLLILIGVAVRKKRWLSYAAVILATVELFLFSRGNLITVPFAVINEKIPAQDWLKGHATYGRFLSTSGNFPYTGLGVYWTHLRAREPFSPNKLTDEELKTFTRLKAERLALPENQGMHLRLFDVSGYAAAIPEPLVNFWNGTAQSPNALSIRDLLDQKLDLAGVKYVVTGYPQDYLAAIAEPGFKQVFFQGDIRIYENLENFPRAFLEYAGKRETAEIMNYAPTDIRIRVATETGGQLILTDTFYPGWYAKLNGKDIPIKVAYQAFRTVSVPPGTHELEFVFRPRSVAIGAIISLGSVVGIALIVSCRKRRKLLW